MVVGGERHDNGSGVARGREWFAGLAGAVAAGHGDRNGAFMSGVFKRTHFRIESAYLVWSMAASACVERERLGSSVLSSQQNTSVHFRVFFELYLDQAYWRIWVLFGY